MLARFAAVSLATLLAALLAPGLASIAFAQEATRTEVAVAGTPQRLEAPAGAHIAKLVALENPRLISLGRDGEMFIGSKADTVYRLTPPYDEAQVLVRLDDYPHSAVRRDDALYVATTDALLRADYHTGATLDADDFHEVAAIPGGGGHSSRSLSLGPDGRLHVSLGIQGNCSNQYLGHDYPFTDRRGGVLVLDESGDTPVWRPYVSGLRNPVGLAWRDDGTLYVNNNGPDHWGFERPREVLERAEPGRFFGMPWFQWVDGKATRDDCIDVAPPQTASAVTPPVATFPARSAPMGLAFLPDDHPLDVDLISVLHGSWATAPNGSAAGDPATRREPALMGVRLDEEGHNGEVVALVTGFQDADGRRWARPVGVAVGDDGAVYFTTDVGETGLYRLTIDD
ncbi:MULTISPECIES: PQQ-dependent sugar dehydrogenase [unclassified Modicisalibacter]|uniref:PQQ-dependent sugar dehydrogenase n=1 Tax=unclassified Modicisalibacter TaxID=2679913 RepID=UPI001CCC0D14|nr:MULTISPECIES: PQQ-dependent sugar dehydrogenase [unclassified Modicisalibacter]MBZ9557673.1 PQQ-dependent sugar dehydrogenase [Modicisalibacter sp. R2A 31.J]MBZ9573663.1 PQQ-dependent sugar dehydrogenase [Modicisalibacter sp. MOD 31.J]